jgi:RHS repeat-associated protein
VPVYDGNGNVTALVTGQGGTSTITGTYEYGPFGESIRSSGSLAKNNPFRFSTKYKDDETDLLYYGYRFYNASTGRWLSRDPIEERGGLNMYSFVVNTPASLVDRDGRSPVVASGAGAAGGVALVVGGALYWLLDANFVDPVEREASEMAGSMDNDIYVEKCQVVIVYGHGSRRNPLRWHVAPGGCSAAGSVTCWSDSNNSNIVQGGTVAPANFFLPIPFNPGGAGEAGADPAAIWTPNRPFWSQQLERSPDRWFNGPKALAKMRDDALARAKEICRQKCCPSVWVRFIRHVVEAGDDSLIPFMGDIPIKCR